MKNNLSFLVFLSLFFFISSSLCFGQDIKSLKGCIKDSINFSSLYNTSIAIINAEDSTLFATIRTRNSDCFNIQLDSGNYIIIISNPQFAEYMDTFSIQSKSRDLGNFYLFSKTYLLQEVVVHDNSAIVIKGDTTIFNADSFKVDKFDNVDELLRRLPGITIDGRGKITAQGEQVKKMYIDGEEFFSDDPTLVSQMLRANVVDKVQIFNDKSERTKFTGIDDGTRIKTINLVIKESAKQGCFGNVRTGIGLHNHFDNQVSINGFENKRKLALFGSLSNINSNSAIAPSFSIDAAQSTASTEGIPKSWGGGFHYDNKWNEILPVIISANYRINKNEIYAKNQTQTIYTLPDNNNEKNEQLISITNSFEQHLDISCEKKIDTFSYFKLNGGFSTDNGNGKSTNLSNTQNQFGASVNSQFLSQTSTINNNNVFLSGIYGRRFRKSGRTIVLNFKSDLQDRKNNSENNSETFFPDKKDSLNQKKIGNTTQGAMEYTATFTEPINKIISLEISYNGNINNNRSSLQSYNISAGDSLELTSFDSTYSNDYKLITYDNSAETKFALNFKKIKFLAGAIFTNSRFYQKNNTTGSDYQRSFSNILPNFRFEYSKTFNTAVTLSYSSIIQNPSIEQIQPLIQNSDPLNTTLGNPALKQQLSHIVSIAIRNVDPIHNRFTILGGSINVMRHAITQIQYIDTLGIRRSQYTNVNGNLITNAFINQSYNLAKSDISLNFTLNYSCYKNISIINGNTNKSINKNYSVNASINYFKSRIFDLNSSELFSFSKNNNSIEPELNNKFFSTQQNLTLNIKPVPNLKFTSTILWSIRQKTYDNDVNNNIIKWNSGISYSLLKDKSLKISLTVYDILNQNTGFRRTVTSGVITNQNFITLGRYSLLTISWNFTHNKDDNSKDE